MLPNFLNGATIKRSPLDQIPQCLLTLQPGNIQWKVRRGSMFWLVCLSTPVRVTVKTSIKQFTSILPTRILSTCVQSAVYSSVSSIYLHAATLRACKPRYPNRAENLCSPALGWVGTWILFLWHICALYSTSTAFLTVSTPPQRRIQAPPGSFGGHLRLPGEHDG